MRDSHCSWTVCDPVSGTLSGNLILSGHGVAADAQTMTKPQVKTETFILKCNMKYGNFPVKEKCLFIISSDSNSICAACRPTDLELKTLTPTPCV